MTCLLAQERAMKIIGIISWDINKLFCPSDHFVLWVRSSVHLDIQRSVL